MFLWCSLGKWTAIPKTMLVSKCLGILYRSPPLSNIKYAIMGVTGGAAPDPHVVAGDFAGEFRRPFRTMFPWGLDSAPGNFTANPPLRKTKPPAFRMQVTGEFPGRCIPGIFQGPHPEIDSGIQDAMDISRGNIEGRQQWRGIPPRNTGQPPHQARFRRLRPSCNPLAAVSKAIVSDSRMRTIWGVPPKVAGLNRGGADSARACIGVGAESGRGGIGAGPNLGRAESGRG